MAVVSTTDGRYFLRVADHSKPVTGDDVMRLASKRAARPWETQTTARRNEHLATRSDDAQIFIFEAFRAQRCDQGGPLALMHWVSKFRLASSAGSTPHHRAMASSIRM